MQGSPTILQIIPRLDTGGAEISTIETTEAVVRAGGRMIVLSEGGRLAPEIKRAGGELIEFPAATKNPVQILANSRYIAALVAQHDVDLLHARSRAPAWSALMAAKRTGKPLVTTYHGAYNRVGPLKNAYNSVMARGDLVVANSEFTARLIQEHHQVPAGRVRVIHRGVDLARFDPAAISAGRIAALRTAWGLAENQRVILHAARLTGWKGQRVLIDAVARLEAEGGLHDAVVIMAGDAQGRDGYTEELHSRIADVRLEDKVRLVGHCADIAAAYRLADVTVVASTEPEAFGRSVAEALAMGCPVIATDLGAPPEILRMGSNTASADERLETESSLRANFGWLVEPGDAAALAGRLGAALAISTSERDVAGRATRAHVAAYFSSEAMKRAKLAVYDELLGTHLLAAFELKSVSRQS